MSLESAIRRLQEAGILVVLAGVRPQPRELLERAGWKDVPGSLLVTASYAEGLERARSHLGAVPDHPEEPAAVGEGAAR